MEIVVLRSDVARLVLGYLKNQHLKRAFHTFCKTSPYLRQDFFAYKQELQVYSCWPELEVIICEYAKISRKVEQLLNILPDGWRTQLQYKNLSEKVTELLERAVETISINSASVNDGGKGNISNSGPNCGVQSDSESSTQKKCEVGDRKRKRSTDDSPSEQTKPCYTAKRRRVFEPFCSLTMQHIRHRGKPPLGNFHYDGLAQSEGNRVDDEYDDEGNDNDGEEWLVTSNSEDEQHDAANSLAGKPRKESTPHNNTFFHYRTPPSLQEISQAILENAEFQNRLVQNINQALLITTNDTLTTEIPSASETKTTSESTITTQAVSTTTSCTTPVSEQYMSSGQLLDQMVKSILEATEKDPTFDAIIEEVLGTPNKSVVSAGVQCNLTPRSDNVSEAPAVTTIPPNTPIVIRTALAGAESSSHNDQHVPTGVALPTNTSFGSLSDPNFSISKLIVMNANESAQKQPPEQSIGNTTADNLLNQLANTTTTTTECQVDDQVFFDPNTGQFTFPLFVTNDGLLANVPFVINSELITQQLQPNTVANLVGSRLEIPLPEPNVVPVDQQPANSFDMGNAQKTNSRDEEQPPPLVSPRTMLKTDKCVSTAISNTLPSSLDARIHVDRATPSSSGIVNAKAYRSLSTPRKRASHVRTLTFSPRTTTLAGTTPISTRRDTISRLKLAHGKAAIEASEKQTDAVSEKLIIENVEVLPRLNAAMAGMDTSCNESSSSCHVPPLFVTEESSNMTVIKGKCPSELEIQSQCAETTNSLATKLFSTEVDTPKRKQQRGTAVRACKRQLSKSSNEDDDDAEQQTHNAENKDKKKVQAEAGSPIQTREAAAKKCENKERAGKSKMIAHTDENKTMEEWQRMRNGNVSDLEWRLRELNAKTLQSKPPVKKELKKRGRRKKPTTRKQKRCQTPKSAVQDETNIEFASVPKTSDQAAEPQSQIKKTERIKRVVVKRGAKKELNVKKSSSQQLPVKQQKTKRKSESAQARTKMKLAAEELNKELALVSAIQLDIDQSSVLDADHISGLAPSLALQMYEHEKRNANIACLLDTPFKEVNTLQAVPPTPGILAPSLETPISKQRPPDGEVHSSSFLFGSLTKSELDTPMLNAITPGFKFTSFDSKDTNPRSAPGTEYSSGGSYYRPDESDDLDRNIDRMLRDTTQRKGRQELEPIIPKSMEHEINSSKLENYVAAGDTALPAELLHIEIPVEKLKVEPIVLHRMKSFGRDSVEDGPNVALQIDPHYTLASGLPDISAEEDDSSESLCSSDSLTSAVFSPNSSANSHSSNPTSKTSSSATRSKILTQLSDKRNTPMKAAFSLEDLSEISSAEDEDWQSLDNSDTEDSQLVDEDGEVRYPVRSWLTPQKDVVGTSQAAAATMTIMLPLKSAEKRMQNADNELQQKRERMKEKLRLDSQNKTPAISSGAASASCINVVSANTRKMKNLLVKDNSSTVTRKTDASVSVAPESRPPQRHPDTLLEEKRAIDVLTALNLSAKKQPPADTTAVASPPPGDIDDNAVSNLFVSQPNSKPSQEVRTKAEHLPLKKLFSTAKAVPRKCLPIEARAVPIKKRGVGRPKKIVQTPLDFNGPNNTEVSTPLPANAAASKVSLSKIKTPASTGSVVGGANTASASKRISPRLLKGINATKSADAAASKPSSSSSTGKTKRGTLTKKNSETESMKLANQIKSDTELSSAKRSKPNAKIVPSNVTKKPTAKAKEKEKEMKKQKSLPKKDNKSKEEEEQETNENRHVATTAAEALPKKALNIEMPMTTTPLTVASTLATTMTTNMTLPLTTTTTPLAPTEVGATHCQEDSPRKNVDNCDYEETDSDSCELISITEMDEKRFIRMCYEGPDGVPKTPLQPSLNDKSDFKMMVTINEHERHTWQFTEELCLFEAQPVQTVQPVEPTQPIHNLPKKRRIRLMTITGDQAGATPNTNISEQMIPAADLQPVATSTPVIANSAVTSSQVQMKVPQATQPKPHRQEPTKAQALRSRSVDTKMRHILPAVPFSPSSGSSSKAANILTAKSTLQIIDCQAISANNAATTPATPTITVTPSSSGLTGANVNTEKIQIEDIESILSHLHGI